MNHRALLDRPWSESVLDALAKSIRTRAGLFFGKDRYDELERRTRQAMAKAGVTDVRDYSERLGNGRISFDDWVSELTVGETYFFREPAHFEFMRQRVLPEILQLRGPDHVYRVWSAGCASGEEAYSLAILFEQQGLTGTVHLMGTDVSRVALAKARSAVYNSWSLRGAADDWISRYFRRAARTFELIDRIKKQVTFEYLNLALDEYPSFFVGVFSNDLILCRNVLIYMDRAAVGAIARRLFDSLADGGWLITGPSDPPLGSYAPYETVVTDWGVFYHRPVRASATFPASTTSDVRSSLSDSSRASAPHVPSAVPTDLSMLERNDATSPRDFPKPASSREKRSSISGERPRVVSAETQDARYERALEALAAGRYALTIDLARKLVDRAEASALEVRATANLLGSQEGCRLCTASLLRFPMNTELHVLQTSLLLDLRDYEGAGHAVRRLLYLDRTLVVAHLLSGSIFAKKGDREGAVRAFRSACELAACTPAADVVPFTDGERAGRLADFARAQIQLLAAEASRIGDETP